MPQLTLWACPVSAHRTINSTRSLENLVAHKFEKFWVYKLMLLRGLAFWSLICMNVSRILLSFFWWKYSLGHVYHRLLTAYSENCTSDASGYHCEYFCGWRVVFRWESHCITQTDKLSILSSGVSGEDTTASAGGFRYCSPLFLCFAIANL